ncbi:hypothetical protein GCM10011502_03380 [Oceanisphaera marina]|uniref:Uncharacterized protein n=1 Tax=Oceanisphaera marina TaxID=2017550 RepID=A0ABQ1IDR6_9GAMM|nr:hypothetical protein [Oceanisphaera marina]GGB33649.1 hypothetical protein GCM10011502_03380 [Oceanisphaera marina]
MKIFSFKPAHTCLLLSLLAAPAMADNIFSGIINFGREVLDETRKLAPGIQDDRRHETSATVRATPDDGRDYPALESSGSNVNVGQTGSHNNVVVGEAPAMQPASPTANQGWQFVEEDHLK